MPHSRTALVTDGSGAINLHMCRKLIRRGTAVIVHAPAAADARAAVDQLVRNGADPALIRAASADFRCLGEVIALAERVHSDHGRLDLIINNAATATSTGRTADGFDTTFQVNYLAPYALTRLLAPALNAAAGRIVTLTSALHADARLDPDKPIREPIQPGEMHARAQLASILFTRMLAQTAEQRVTAVAVNPAGDGVAAVLHAADPHLQAVNGGYYEGLLPAPPPPQTCDDDAARRLWSATARLLGWDYTAAAVAAASTSRPSPSRMRISTFPPHAGSVHPQTMTTVSVLSGWDR